MIFSLFFREVSYQLIIIKSEKMTLKMKEIFFCSDFLFRLQTKYKKRKIGIYEKPCGSILPRIETKHSACMRVACPYTCVCTYSTGGPWTFLTRIKSANYWRLCRWALLYSICALPPSTCKYRKWPERS